MGLKEKTVSDKKYLMVKHHSIILESKTPVDGWEEIKVENPQTKEIKSKWIRRWAALEGMIKKLEWYDTGNQYKDRFMGLKIHIADAGEYFQLDLPFNTRPYDSFVKLAENIDYTQPVEFSVWYDKKQETTAFAVRQNGVPVKWKYTKEDMGECPLPTQNALGKWNFDGQREWLWLRLTQVIIPHVETINAFDEPQPEYEAVDLETPIEVIEAEPEVTGFMPPPPPETPALSGTVTPSTPVMASPVAAVPVDTVPVASVVTIPPPIPKTKAAKPAAASVSQGRMIGGGQVKAIEHYCGVTKAYTPESVATEFSHGRTDDVTKMSEAEAEAAIAAMSAMPPA